MAFVVLLLPLRGILLWVVIPVAIVVFPILVVIQEVRRRQYPSLRKHLSWADTVLVVTLMRTVLRPLAPSVPSYPPWATADEDLPPSSFWKDLV